MEFLDKNRDSKLINTYFKDIFNFAGIGIITLDSKNNIECARGLSSFSSIEIEKIKGHHSSKIKNILGYSGREEIIHKDDLVKV